MEELAKKLVRCAFENRQFVCIYSDELILHTPSNTATLSLEYVLDDPVQHTKQTLLAYVYKFEDKYGGDEIETVLEDLVEEDILDILQHIADFKIYIAELVDYILSDTFANSRWCRLYVDAQLVRGIPNNLALRDVYEPLCLQSIERKKILDFAQAKLLGAVVDKLAGSDILGAARLAMEEYAQMSIPWCYTADEELRKLTELLTEPTE